MFYKNNKGQVSKGNHIISEDYKLIAEKKDDYKLPIDGWFWFENDDAAYAFFGIEKPIPVPDPHRKDNTTHDSKAIDDINNKIAVLQSRIDELKAQKIIIEKRDAKINTEE